MIGWLSHWVASAHERRVLRRRPIPDEMWITVLQRFPFLQRQDPHEAERLRRLATLFLARKDFIGAHGFVVDDAVALAVAAQACLPVLNLGLHWYDGFVGIVMHSDQMVARREFVDDHGIVHEYEEVLSGEAMEAGPVTLSWRDVADAGTSAEWAYNVVIHEFAHVLDMCDGAADGMPPLANRVSSEAWRRVIHNEMSRARREARRGRDMVLDSYGLDSSDEFFAVASEAFFVQPVRLNTEHPALYALLADFYRQDPLRQAVR